MFIFFITFFINFQILLFSSGEKSTLDLIKQLDEIGLDIEQKKKLAKKLTPYEINTLSTYKPNELEKLGKEGVEEFDQSQIKMFEKRHIDALGLKLIYWLKPEQISWLNVNAIKWLSPEQIRGLTPEQIQALTMEQIHALEINQIIYFSRDQIQNLKHKFNQYQRKNIIEYYNREENQDDFLEDPEELITRRQLLLLLTDEQDDRCKELSTFHLRPRDNKIAYFSTSLFGLTFLPKIKESLNFHCSNNNLYIIRTITFCPGLLILMHKIYKKYKFDTAVKNYY